MRCLSALILTLAACGTTDDPCKRVAGTCIGLPSGSSPDAVQSALIQISSGGTVAFGAGTFDFTTDLSLSVDHVTIQGAGMDSTILSFKHQTNGAQGLYVTAKAGFAIHDLAIEDTRGDALKMLGTDGVTIQRTRIEWTAGPNATNGSY